MNSGILRVLVGLVGAFVTAVCTETLLTCGYAGIWLLASQSVQNTGDGLSFIAITAMYASGSIALPTIILIALPYAVVSNYWRKSSRRYYLWSGLVIGLLAIVAAGIWHYRYPGPPIRADFDMAFFAISSMVTGVIAALAFWLIARPDRLQHQLPASN